MLFLIDEDLPRSAGDLVRRFGYETIETRDTHLRGGEDPAVYDFARAHDLCLITGDFDFADIRCYPPSGSRGIVVLKLPKNATARYITSLLETFVSRGDLVSQVDGRLAIVEPGRVRFRKSLSDP
ncbi:MAG: DUF5615 family PIN-like protein [Deltaproteobacteria bacterium]|nr:DUF5615 family PIN-like protein [Deltaproteobacteria bacterium]